MLEFLSGRLLDPNCNRLRYVEPFVGGGAVFFLLQPRHAVLSDMNRDLIDLYRGIRRSPEAVWQLYCAFGNNKAEYERVRSLGAAGELASRAARILFLNRTCFKGMWRHNRDGEFNVGYGGQSRRWVINEESLRQVARSLRNAQISCCDFEAVVDQCGEGDFLFLDPPYRPGEKEQLHDHYLSRRFTFDDHRRLAASLRRAKRRGALWAITTSAHTDIVALFRGNFIHLIPRGTGPLPGTTISNSGEVLITNYQI